MEFFRHIIYSSPWRVYIRQSGHGPRIFAHTLFLPVGTFRLLLSLLLHCNPGYHFRCFDLLGSKEGE